MTEHQGGTAWLADIEARSQMVVSTRADGLGLEARSALRVEDVTRLLRLVERQRDLLDECATVLAHDYEFDVPELCPGWDELDYEERGSYLAKAVLSLLLEVRHA